MSLFFIPPATELGSVLSPRSPSHTSREVWLLAQPMRCLITKLGLTSGNEWMQGDWQVSMASLFGLSTHTPAGLPLEELVPDGHCSLRFGP